MDGKVDIPLLGVLELDNKEYVCVLPKVWGYGRVPCCGCAFIGKYDLCFSVECSPQFREDRQQVVFIENTKRL